MTTIIATRTAATFDLDNVERAIWAAECRAESLRGSDGWQDAVELAIFDLLDNRADQEEAIVRFNMRMFHACGVI